MKRLLALLTATLCGTFSYAQLLNWSPAFPTENNSTQTFVITMDATKGNQGLLNHTPLTDVYVHIGVITSKSTSSSDWKYVRDFGVSNNLFNTAVPQLNAPSAGTNKWAYTITGSLRTFFGITDATETIRKIAILFRSGNGSKVQRNADGSDMYLPIYGATEFAVRLSQPPRQPKFIPEPEPQPNLAIGSTLPVAADASKPSAMKLYHNGAIIATSAGNVSTLTATATIMASGTQQIIAEAADGGTTRYDTINLFVAASPIAALPAGVQDGLNYNTNNTSVTLVLRAPGKGSVTVIGDFNNWTQGSAYIMNKTPDGQFFWLTLNGLTSGTEYGYQYLVDGSIKVADPYAEKILDPGQFADAQISPTTYPALKPYPTGLTTGIVSVLQTAAPAYTWSNNTFARPNQRGLVIYELLVRDFISAHDFKTLKDTLTYLKRLGVNAIEVMPWTEFENNSSWGYNTFQYFAPDKYYGPKNTLKQFIDSCHKYGFAVIMDVVLNHTYGPSPLRDLYFDGSRPTTANPWYNQVAPHAFGFGDDFNHASPHTKYFFNRVLKHWVQEYKIDGYRFDFTKGLTQKPSTDDVGFSAYDASRIAILKSYWDSIKVYDPASYAILEHFCVDQEEKELADYGFMLWANVWTQYQQASMGYSSNSSLDRAVHTSRNFNSPHLVTFMESHDEERVTFKNINFGASSGSYNVKDTATALKRMELAAAFMLTIPGPKMIWQFGELGYDYSRCYLATNGDGGDCNTKLDPKPIRWDYQNEARRKSVFNVYAQLNRLRTHPQYKGIFENSTITSDLSGFFKTLTLKSSGDTANLVVIGNFNVTAQSGTVTFPSAGTYYDYFGNFIHTATGSAQTFSLQPGEWHVYVNRNLNGVTPTPVVNVPWNGSTLEAKAYPNPVVNGAWQVELKLPQSGTTTIELFNSVGQRITTLHNGFVAAGTRVLPMPALHGGKGVYYLKISSKAATKTVSITLQ